MTTVAAVMRRSYTAGMFDDLNLPPHVRSFDKSSGVTTLTFAGTLTAGEADSVFARMESKDDTDQARRAALRADLATLPEGPLRRTICYLLGDSGL